MRASGEVSEVFVSETPQCPVLLLPHAQGSQGPQPGQWFVSSGPSARRLTEPASCSQGFTDPLPRPGFPVRSARAARPFGPPPGPCTAWGTAYPAPLCPPAAAQTDLVLETLETVQQLCRLSPQGLTSLRLAACLISPASCLNLMQSDCYSCSPEAASPDSPKPL